jgi:deazaflavin-dependent oxidoreductase (nitroreductase family)
MRLVRIPWLLRLVTRLHVAAYRATGGRIGGRLAGAPVLLLYHVGRKSGKTFVAPLLCLEDGTDLAVVASYGGSPSDPAWWLNLQGAGGWGRVQLASRTFDVRAEMAPAPRRQALWERFVQSWPPYEDYRKATTREIPVIILHYVETERMRATCNCLNGAWVPSR